MMKEVIVPVSIGLQRQSSKQNLGAGLDLFVTNDRIRKFLYFNDGQGNFTENREEMITYNFGLSFGHSWSDYDHDGDLDLAVATHSNQKNYVFKNNRNFNICA